jgi:hypothetical protein
MNKNGHVFFQLTRVNTLAFATFEANLLAESPGKIGAAVNFSIDDKVQRVECVARFEIILEDPIAVIEVSCEFAFEEEAWQALKNAKGTSITIPKNIAQHLGVLTVGTARGVLHAKTENTPFNQYYLPQINVTELVETNVKFELG